MKTKILLFFLCITSLNMMGQGVITRKKQQPTTQTTSKHVQRPKLTSKATPTPQKSTVEATGYDVTFTCNVSSATLYVDGIDSGNASGTRFLKTGNHKIKATANGYEDYSFSITIDKGNTSFSITLNKTPEPVKPLSQPSGYVSGHSYVDLGLSIKWATCNVGANSPSDNGGYYAWGETSTKSNYNWDNCFDCVKSEERQEDSAWGIYKQSGQTRILPTSGHDTARENWGGTWRMPTDTETNELREKCKWTWTSQDGHNGYQVTGPNGNSIFLPAAGFRSYTDTYYVGEAGYYWLSTLSSSESNCALSMTFSRQNSHKMGGIYRCIGQSVRPVTE